ncbi:MAG: major capsid protein [Halobacteria archaeon]
MPITPTPYSTPYEYVGEDLGLGSLELTMLAQSFAEVDFTELDMFFPAQNIQARTVTIETQKTSLGLMRMVDMGMPDYAGMPNDRIERRQVEPAVFRESDFFDQGFINQIRENPSSNQATPVEQIIQRRINRLVSKRNRTINYLQSQVLLGGINYEDPYTGAKADVPTQIPQNNYFHYKGFDSSVSAEAQVDATHDLRAYSDMVNDKGRKEALLFTSSDGYAGVPWTHPRADILASLRWILNYLEETNKNRYTDIVMARSLLTVLMENQLIKAHSGQYAFSNFAVNPNNTQNTPVAGQNIMPPGASAGRIEMDSTGTLTSISGLNIVTMRNLFLDPQTNKHLHMWPINKVALVARDHQDNPGETLGQTVHPIAEGPNQEPGMWLYSSDVEYDPPNPPGRAVQMGDSFLPFATYPQWISVLTVCESDDVYAKQILRADSDFGLAF